ncbi:MAG: hypothetical protein R2731_00780 [Nocardioides sp.]
MPAVQRGVVGLADDTTGRVQHGEGLGELGEVAEVLHGGVAAHLALADERRPVDRPEGHAVAADVDRVLGVARLNVELARGLGHLLEHEVGVEEDLVVLHPLPRGPEQVERPGIHELHAELGHEPPPAAVEGGHRLLGQDLVARHLVVEHVSSGRHEAVVTHPSLTMWTMGSTIWNYQTRAATP